MIRKKNIFSKNTARILFLIPGIFLLSFFQRCAAPKEHKVSAAFYYWKTRLHISPYEYARLKNIHASTLYIRLFDVDWDNNLQEALPLGILHGDSHHDTALHYIPVIYITQSCLTRLRENDLPRLAANMDSLIHNLCNKYQFKPEEIQIDCDWTKNSAALYFNLLKQLKAKNYFRSKLLSCTIRMHQVKFTASSGIPPVDRGLLMVYNMGNLTRYGAQNSILDVAEAKKYLKHISIYPLPLDVALPLYHWSALFEHKHFKGIVYNISREDFQKKTIVQKEYNLYSILKDTITGGYHFKQGQEIRFEHPEQKDLERIASYISDNIRDTAFRVAFFHLDSLAMKQYQSNDLNDILNTFR